MNTTTISDTIKNLDKKVLYGAAVTAAFAVIGFGALTYGKTPGDAAPAAKSEDPIPVKTLTVATQPVDAVITAAGTLNSRNSSLLSSKIMGKVLEMNVREGDSVTAGRVLLRIESGEITAQTYQAQAAYNNANLQFDRIKSLFGDKAATQMEMDQAVLELESARAGLNAAKAMESYTRITAPIAGQIVEKRINLGEMALPGQPIIKIEDNSSLRLEVAVAEQDISAVQTGNSVIVQIDALPGKNIRARVAQVVPAADAHTHSFIVKIDVPSSKSLITGMYGKALFKAGRRATILIPRSAIVTMSGLPGVYIKSADGHAVFQMVQPGEIQGDMIEAVTGLKAGDTIVVSKQQTSIDGRKIIVAAK